MAPGCCISPAYVCVDNVGVCVAGSSMGKGVTEEEERKRLVWCLRVCCVEVCVKELRNVHKGEGGGGVMWFTHTESLLLGWGCH